MDRFKQPLSQTYADGRQESPIFKHYDHLGEYMEFYKLGVTSWKIVSLDEDGIPINMHHGAQHYNPVTIAHYVLELYSNLLHNGYNEKNEARLRKVLDWCLRKQNRDGGWGFSFDHLFFKGRVALMKAPWYSALSQGMMISALVRAGSMFEIDVRDPIRRSLDIILTDVERGGVKRLMWDRYAFYEEYPTTPASYVLNGFMFCLLGLYDGYKATDDAKFLKAFEDGIRTLEISLPLYDLGNGSSYDLTHVASKVEGPNKARHSYHRLHVQLLSTLDVIADGKFSRVVNRWNSYLCGNELITN